MTIENIRQMASNVLSKEIEKPISPNLKAKRIADKINKTLNNSGFICVICNGPNDYSIDIYKREFTVGRIYKKEASNV